MDRRLWRSAHGSTSRHRLVLSSRSHDVALPGHYRRPWCLHEAVDDCIRYQLDPQRRNHGIHLSGEQPLAAKAAEGNAVIRGQTPKSPKFNKDLLNRIWVI